MALAISAAMMSENTNGNIASKIVQQHMMAQYM